MLGKTEGKKRSGRQRMRWLDSIIESTDMNLSKHWETDEQKSLEYCCKEYNQSDFSVDHLVMSMCRVFSCVLEEDVSLHAQGKRNPSKTDPFRSP